MFKKTFIAAGVAAMTLTLISAEVSARQSRGANDVVGGVKLRGNGTVDDTQPTATTPTTTPGATTPIKLRGDGTVDDNNNNRRRGRGR